MEGTQHVYAVLAHVRPTPQCALVPPQARDVLARCYASAASEGLAIVRVVTSLQAIGLDTLSIQWSGALMADEVTDGADADARDCERRAREGGGVIVCKLDLWFGEDDDA